MKNCNCIPGRFAILGVCLLLLFSFLANHGSAQQIVVNEIYNSSANDEWVELLVVQDNLDIRGWDFRDFSSAGTAQQPLAFASSSLWSSLKKGTIIIVGTATTTFTEDTDPSDYLIKLKLTNGLYFTGTGVFSFAGSSEAFQIRDGSATHVFGVSWGTNNAGSLPAPKVHFSGGSTSNTSTVFNEDTTPELTTTTNWSQNVASSQGVGNSVANSAWIASLRAHPDGSGHAIAKPDTIVHGNSYTLQITFFRDTSFALTDMRIVIPPSFTWSHLNTDVSYTNMTATQSISGDTIYFNSIALADSTVITVSNVTAPDSTAKYFLVFQSKSITAYDNLSPSPSVIGIGIPSQISIAKENDVNGIPLRIGQLVTLRGIVTVANEFQGPSYIQDNTGGIGFFDPLISPLLTIGDEVIVTGTIAPFNGLCEITNLLLQEIVSTGNSIDPVVVTASQLKNDGAGGIENYEGSLVRVNLATVTDTFGTHIASWTVAGSGTNYRLNDASGYVDIRVDNNVNFANTPAPQANFDVVGVVSQFKAASPYIGGYQLIPRSSADIISKGPIFGVNPHESNITASSFRVNWTTIDSGTTRLRYGLTTAYELGVVSPDDQARKIHAIDLMGLTAATIYHIQAFSVKDPDTSLAGDLIVSTASPLGSTGQIHVYFNKSVNSSVATVENAIGGENFVSRILARINNASHSISAAFYSLSGASEGDVIASALVAAKNRGVTVRIICEADNRGTTAFNSIAAAGIPIITDAYDPVWAGQGLSHNKFAVIDYDGGAPESVWVWSGSWNPTNPGTNSDRQNSIEIQDVALAGAYTTEFNEMWGSTTNTPNQSQTRFGARKRDNTPHHFVIGGVDVESYFSPSDHVTSHIAATLRKAQHSVAVAVLTFTRKDLADTLIARKNAADKVRILIDNNTDTGNQYSYLQSNSMDVHLKVGSGLLHHKYASIDGDQISGPQYTITGSHNWSNSAEGSNDENTLIIQNNRIANLYLQEFAARYYESGGTDSIHVVTSPNFGVAPASRDFGIVDTGLTKQDSVTVTNTGNAVLTVSPVTSTNSFFTVTPESASVAPSGNQKFYITFAPHVAQSDSGAIIFTHNAGGSPDSVFVRGTGHADTIVTPSDTASVVYQIVAGWNMVSLPLQVTDARKATLFPTATTKAFAYTGLYLQKDTLLNGVGYWLKFALARTDTITGVKIDAETTHVSASWNIIGTTSKAVATSAITQDPPGIVVSNYYGYSGAYFVADSLKPGRAYWVKTNTAGSLMMSGTLAVPKGAKSDNLSQMSSLTITDEKGHSQKLYFGFASEGISADRFEAPPIPPGGGFDARFASGRLLEIVGETVEKSSAYPIAIRTSNFPIKIGWTIDSKDNNYYTLGTPENAEIIDKKLSGSGEITLRKPTETLVLAVKTMRTLPQEYSLGQNYPNPFNPKTTISFTLPRASTVTLKVYNILGEVVMTLFENEVLEGGYVESSMDGSQLASGVYIYRLTATSREGGAEAFHQEKKLLLVK